MPRTSRPLSITLGELQERVQARVKSGAYASASEVLRAAVRALDREEAALDAALRQRMDAAVGVPNPAHGGGAPAAPQTAPLANRPVHEPPPA